MTYFLEIISNFYKLYAEVLTFHTYFKSIFLRHVTSVTQIDLLLHKLSAQYFKDLVRTLCLFRYICGPPDSPKMHHFPYFFKKIPEGGGDCRSPSSARGAHTRALAFDFLPQNSQIFFLRLVDIPG